MLEESNRLENFHNVTRSGRVLIIRRSSAMFSVTQFTVEPTLARSHIVRRAALLALSVASKCSKMSLMGRHKTKQLKNPRFFRPFPGHSSVYAKREKV